MNKLLVILMSIFLWTGCSAMKNQVAIQMLEKAKIQVPPGHSQKGAMQYWNEENQRFTPVITFVNASKESEGVLLMQYEGQTIRELHHTADRAKGYDLPGFFAVASAPGNAFEKTRFGIDVRLRSEEHKKAWQEFALQAIEPIRVKNAEAIAKREKAEMEKVLLARKQFPAKVQAALKNGQYPASKDEATVAFGVGANPGAPLVLNPPFEADQAVYAFGSKTKNDFNVELSQDTAYQILSAGSGILPLKISSKQGPNTYEGSWDDPETFKSYPYIVRIGHGKEQTKKIRSGSMLYGYFVLVGIDNSIGRPVPIFESIYLEVK